GDLGLWLAGRTLGRRALRWSWLQRRINLVDQEKFGRWFDQNAAGAILCSRFVPGARLPMYFGAGATGRKPLAFVAWTFLAALIWTPLLVLLIASLGSVVSRPFEKIFGRGWIVLLVAIAVA